MIVVKASTSLHSGERVTPFGQDALTLAGVMTTSAAAIRHA
jgi:hypothetical protein